MNIEGRVAIVTGSATGIGKAIAERFAREQAIVIAVDIDGATLAETCQAITAAGGTIEAVSADAGDPDAVHRLVEDAVARHGAVHIGVANAAIQYEKGIEDTPSEDWDKVLALNLRGAYLLAKNLIPHMRRQGGDR